MLYFQLFIIVCYLANKVLLLLLHYDLVSQFHRAATSPRSTTENLFAAVEVEPWCCKHRVRPSVYCADGFKCMAGTRGNAAHFSNLAFPGLKQRFFCWSARSQAGELVFDISLLSLTC